MKMISATPPPDESTKKILSETAVAAVLKAGGIQRQGFGNGIQAEIVHPKDLKTAVDRECESVMVDTIRNQFPRHRILAEEGGNLGGEGDYLWIIDPLDGTVNYFHGLHQFCACAACCYLPYGKSLPDNGSSLVDCTLIGAVYAPLMDELYVGISGMGAALNDNPLSLSPNNELSELIIAVSFGKTESGIDRMSDLCRILARKARKLRSFGSAGLDIVQAAYGRLGGVLYRGIHIWDIAAAGIILKEAGGMISAALKPNGTWNMVASASGVHEELVKISSKPKPFL
jgi:fructose-1,6-bisphosphatase/inositol monophosphatase family enzyme